MSRPSEGVAGGRVRRRLEGVTGGPELYPLLVLFGLNAVDELDRTAFGLLLPNIRDHFDIGNLGATLLIVAILPVPLLFGIPVAYLADRFRRIPIVVAGASAWMVFSVVTGLSPILAVLALARIGSGLGRAVNDPVHGSLLSDYYRSQNRTKVFGAHRAANSVGAFFGPISAGFIAAAFGWRVPFFILAVPTLLLVLAALRLREPARTGRRFVDTVPRFRESFRIMWGVRTLRRIWLGVPFLAVTSIGVQFLFSIYYEDVFEVEAAGRGLIQSFDAPFIVLGFLIGTPLIDRGIATDPGATMRRIGIVAGGIAFLIVGMAVAPALWMSIAFAYGTAALAVVLVAGGTSVISLASPPETRAMALSFFGIFALAGVVTLPLVGWVMDTYGVRWGMATLAPVLLIGAAIVASSGRFAAADIAHVHDWDAATDE